MRLIICIQNTLAAPPKSTAKARPKNEVGRFMPERALGIKRRIANYICI